MRVRDTHSGRTVVVCIGVAVLIASTVATAPAPTFAGGVPSGPRFSYRMVGVSVAGSRVRGESIGPPKCAPSNGGTVSLSGGGRLSNAFSVTAGLDFSTLASLLASKISVPGGITSSTTATGGVSVTLNRGQCAQMFALRDQYGYTLQKRCNWACTSASPPGSWVFVGAGSYDRLIGSASYLV